MVEVLTRICQAIQSLALTGRYRIVLFTTREQDLKDLQSIWSFIRSGLQGTAASGHVVYVPQAYDVSLAMAVMQHSVATLTFDDLGASLSLTAGTPFVHLACEFQSFERTDAIGSTRIASRQSFLSFLNAVRSSDLFPQSSFSSSQFTGQPLLVPKSESVQPLADYVMAVDELSPQGKNLAQMIQTAILRRNATQVREQFQRPALYTQQLFASVLYDFTDFTIARKMVHSADFSSSSSTSSSSSSSSSSSGSRTAPVR
jgi:hypothetical protein